MRRAGHVALMVESRGAYRVLVGKSDGKRPFGRLGRRLKIVIKWIFRKWNVGAWTGTMWFRIGTDGGHL